MYKSQLPKKGVMLLSLWPKRYENITGGAFLSAAIFLVLIDIFGDLTNPEIHNYVLFDKINVGKYNVQTGIRFDSNNNQNIDQQWCYIATDGVHGSIIEVLVLAVATGAQPPEFTDIRGVDLRKFGLSHSSLSEFIKTHCRFR